MKNIFFLSTAGFKIFLQLFSWFLSFFSKLFLSKFRFKICRQLFSFQQLGLKCSTNFCFQSKLGKYFFLTSCWVLDCKEIFFLSTAWFKILNKFVFTFYSLFSDCLATFCFWSRGLKQRLKTKKLLKMLNPAVKSKNVFQENSCF